MDDRTMIHVGGSWREATGGRTIRVENPTTEQVVATAPEAPFEDVDAAGYHPPVAPFGGYKQSDIGREMGIAGLEEYLETTSIGLR